MSVSCSCSFTEVSSVKSCGICLDGKTHFHECITCGAYTCHDCVNGFAKACYDYGREPSCGFCRAPVKLHEVWTLGLNIWLASQESQVGEKRSRDSDQADLSWVDQPIPPVSWRSYFQWIEKTPLLRTPSIDTNEIVDSDTFSGLVDLTALDDPEFFLENDGMLPLPEPDEDGWRVRRRDLRRARRRLEASELSPGSRKLYCSESSLSC